MRYCLRLGLSESRAAFDLMSVPVPLLREPNAAVAALVPSISLRIVIRGEVDECFSNQLLLVFVKLIELFNGGKVFKSFLTVDSLLLGFADHLRNLSIDVFNISRSRSLSNSHVILGLFNVPHLVHSVNDLGHYFFILLKGRPLWLSGFDNLRLL